MTALKQKAVDMIERMPDEKIKYIIQIIEGVDKLFPDDTAEENKKKRAFEELEKLVKSVPDIDEKTELENYRREKYGI